MTDVPSPTSDDGSTTADLTDRSSNYITADDASSIDDGDDDQPISDGISDTATGRCSSRSSAGLRRRDAEPAGTDSRAVNAVDASSTDVAESCAGYRDNDDDDDVCVDAGTIDEIHESAVGTLADRGDDDTGSGVVAERRPDKEFVVDKRQVLSNTAGELRADADHAVAVESSGYIRKLTGTVDAAGMSPDPSTTSSCRVLPMGSTSTSVLLVSEAWPLRSPDRSPAAAPGRTGSTDDVVRPQCTPPSVSSTGNSFLRDCSFHADPDPEMVSSWSVDRPALLTAPIQPATIRILRCIETVKRSVVDQKATTTTSEFKSQVADIHCSVKSFCK